jgi:hypothetical protein
MSGSIRSPFRFGPFQGWNLEVRWTDNGGEVARATVTLEAPRPDGRPLVGGLFVAPHVNGYSLVRDVVYNAGGHDRNMRVARWLLGSLRTALMGCTDDIPAVTQDLWRELIERADDAEAHWLALPENARRRHPFEVLAELIVDASRVPAVA